MHKMKRKTMMETISMMSTSDVVSYSDPLGYEAKETGLFGQSLLAK